MTSYPNSGNLFRNRKRKNDKQPEYDGKAEIDGTEYRMAAWVNEARDGSKFTPADAQAAAGEENQDAESDEVPF